MFELLLNTALSVLIAFPIYHACAWLYRKLTGNESPQPQRDFIVEDHLIDVEPDLSRQAAIEDMMRIDYMMHKCRHHPEYPSREDSQ